MNDTSTPLVQHDWSNSFLYSHTLAKFNYKYPPDHFGFYFVVGCSGFIISKAFWRTWNMRKAMEAKNPLDLSVHRLFSGLTDQQLKDVTRLGLRPWYKVRALAKAGIILVAYDAYVQWKNEK